MQSNKNLPQDDEGYNAANRININTAILSGINKLLLVQQKYFERGEILISVGEGSPFDNLNVKESEEIAYLCQKAV